jgi:hypothetical protein
MTHSINVLKPMLAVSIFLLAFAFSIDAFGQSLLNSVPVAQGLRVEVVSGSLRASRSTELISFKEESVIRKSADASQLIDQVNAIPNSSIRAVLNKVASESGNLSVGERRMYEVKTPFESTKGLKGNTFNVRVSYEARPVGGIIQVTVELVKDFSGIGVTNRPIARESYTQSIDEFSQELTDKVIADLKINLTAKFEALAAAK